MADAVASATAAPLTATDQKGIEQMITRKGPIFACLLKNFIPPTLDQCILETRDIFLGAFETPLEEARRALAVKSEELITLNLLLAQHLFRETLERFDTENPTVIVNDLRQTDFLRSPEPLPLRATSATRQPPPMPTQQSPRIARRTGPLRS
jgi:hypothetical protein